MTTRTRLPLARLEWLALALAVALAHGFYWRIVRFPSEFDARNYLDIATDIARQGLFSKYYYSQVRTYGYPLYLRVLRAIAGENVAVWQWLIFESQLALHLAAALALRAAVAVRRPTAARVLFGALVLNVFALAFTPESLTESLSLTLLLFGAAQWMRLREPGAIPWARVLAGSLIAGAAVMVRPANLFAFAAWWVAVAIGVRERRLGRRSVAAVALALVVGSALPMVPQLVNNVVQYDQPTPLVATSLARFQQIWGIWYIKYATALPPVPNPSIFYYNPFAQGLPVDESRPLQWYREHPGPGLATVALHVFDLTDPDLLFTYNRTLDPWYRIPLGVATHALVAVALAGALVAWRRRHDRFVRDTAWVLGVLVAAHVALHASTAVEVRFGLPLLVLAPPAALWTLACWRADRTLLRGTWLAAWVVLYVAGALSLSTWVRAQAPSIRAWEKAHAAVAAPARERVAAVIVPGPSAPAG